MIFHYRGPITLFPEYIYLCQPFQTILYLQPTSVCTYKDLLIFLLFKCICNSEVIIHIGNKYDFTGSYNFPAF